MIHFVENEKSRSGNGSGVWKVLQEYLEKENIRYKKWNTAYPGHAKEIAKEISFLDGEQSIIVLGGDGTANEVINGIRDFEKVSFGIIPTGSGNDLARGLGIKGEPLTILKNMLSSKGERTIDLGKVSWVDEKEHSRLFAISSGVGMDALVCKKTITSPVKKFLNKLHLGNLSYLVLTIQSLFSMKTTNAWLNIDNNKENYKKVIFSAAMNFPAEGGGVPMAPAAKANDGLLSLCTVHGIPKWRTFLILPFLVAAKHEKFKGIVIRNGKKITIDFEEPEVLHADGEYLGDVTNVTFTCIPGVLRLLVSY